MALIKCPECGKEISDLAPICPNCGFPIASTPTDQNAAPVGNETPAVPYPEGQAPIPEVPAVPYTPYPEGSGPIPAEPVASKPGKKRKAGKIVAAVLLSLVLLIAAGGAAFYFLHTHTYGEWKIVREPTCTEDGAQKRICSQCRKAETLSIEATGHTWVEATCVEPKTCSVCNETEGELGDHAWISATCAKPKTCSVCKETEGEPLDHNWTSATCTSPQKCSWCGKIGAKALGHNKVNFKCSRCGIDMVTKEDVPSILDIEAVYYDVNSVNGIDIYTYFTNKTSKTIKYITWEIEFYNAVQDILKSEIGGRTSAVLKATGPINPGTTSQKMYWDACFYSPGVAYVHIKQIIIEYTDGSKITLDEDIASSAVVAWR